MEFQRVLNLWPWIWKVPPSATFEIFSSSDSEFNSLSDSEKKLIGGGRTGGGRNDNRLVWHLKILKIFKISPILASNKILGPH